MVLWIWLQLQSLLISDDNCRYEVVASNILKDSTFLHFMYLGCKHAGLYCTQAKTSCSWVNF